MQNQLKYLLAFIVQKANGLFLLQLIFKAVNGKDLLVHN